MGKATIISEQGEGRYTIQPEWDTTIAIARVATITAENTAIDTRLGTIDIEISDAEFDYNYATDVLSAAIINQAPESEIETKQRDALTKQAEWQGLKKTKSFLRLRKTANSKQIEFIEEMTAAPAEVLAWCADYTEGATGVVGTVEIGRRDTTPIIKPGGETGTDVAFTALTDGRLVPLMSGSPSATFYNLAMLPGAAKWKPRFRIGTASNINTTLDTMTVTLDALLISNVACNQETVLTSVPVVYMNCNADAFENNDKVLVEFTGLDWLAPKVVGFAAGPKPCDIATIFILQGASSLSVGELAAIGIRGNSWSVVGGANTQGGSLDWRGNGRIITYFGPQNRNWPATDDTYGSSIFEGGVLLASTTNIIGASIASIAGVDTLIVLKTGGEVFSNNLIGSGWVQRTSVTIPRVASVSTSRRYGRLFAYTESTATPHWPAHFSPDGLSAVLMVPQSAGLLAPWIARPYKVTITPGETWSATIEQLEEHVATKTETITNTQTSDPTTTTTSVVTVEKFCVGVDYLPSGDVAILWHEKHSTNDYWREYKVDDNDWTQVQTTTIYIKANNTTLYEYATQIRSGNQDYIHSLFLTTALAAIDVRRGIVAFIAREGYVFGERRGIDLVSTFDRTLDDKGHVVINGVVQTLYSNSMQNTRSQYIGSSSPSEDYLDVESGTTVTDIPNIGYGYQLGPADDLNFPGAGIRIASTEAGYIVSGLGVVTTEQYSGSFLIATAETSDFIGATLTSITNLAALVPLPTGDHQHYRYVYISEVS